MASFFEPGGPIFTYPFSATALSTTGNTDLWCVTAPSAARLAIREIRLGQYSDFGDAQAELLSLLYWTGSTAIGGGTAITGQNYKRYTGAATAASSVTGPSTTLASTTSAAVVIADVWNVAAPYLYIPKPDERIILGIGQRFNLRISTPNDPLTLNGTLVLQDLGAGLPA